MKAKIDRQINNKKVGYEEIFDRHGDRYQTVYANLSSVEQAMFKRYQCEVVLQKNLPKLDKKAMDKILNDCGSNLRRLRIEIVKYKNPVS